MNFDKIDIIKYNNKCLKIWTTDDQKLDKINFDLDNMTCPFGLEKFADTSYINWIIDDELEKLLKITDNSFYKEMMRRNDMYTAWQWISAIRSKDKHKTLLRTKYNNDENKVSDYKQHTYNINIVLDSIWLNNKTKTFGIIWLTDIIY